MTDTRSQEARALTNRELAVEVLCRAPISQFAASTCDYCDARNQTTYGFGPDGVAVIAACLRCAVDKHVGLLRGLV